MTGKTENTSALTVGLVSPATRNMLMAKSALAGLPIELAKEEIESFGRSRSGGVEDTPRVTKRKYRESLRRMALREDLSPLELDSLKWSLKKEGMRYEEIRDTSGPKMGLPKEEVTQMRNRAKNPSNQNKKKGSKVKKAIKKMERSSTRTVTAPLNSGVVFANTFMPKDYSTRTGSRILINREPVATINQTANFSQVYLSTNPGDTGCFTWLSQQAAGYEKYKWRSLKFMFVGAAPPGTTQGAVIVYPDYDSNDQSSSSPLRAMQNQNAVQFPGWEPRVFSPELITPDIRKMSPLLIYKGKLTSTVLGNDFPLYNYLSVWAGYANSTSSASSNNAGTLYAEYEVELIHPTGEGIFSASIAKNVAAGVTTAKPFLTTDIVSQTNYGVVNVRPIGSSEATYMLPSNTDFQAFLKRTSLSYPFVSLTGGFNGDQNELFFPDDFEGIIAFRIYGGALTGEGASNQIIMTPNPNISYGLGGVSISANGFYQGSGDAKTEMRAVQASAGTSVVLTLGGGLSIDTTANASILMIPTGPGSFTYLNSWLGNTPDA